MSVFLSVLFSNSYFLDSIKARDKLGIIEFDFEFCHTSALEFENQNFKA